MIMDRSGVEGYEVSASAADVPFEVVLDVNFILLNETLDLLDKVHI